MSLGISWSVSTPTLYASADFAARIVSTANDFELADRRTPPPALAAILRQRESILKIRMSKERPLEAAKRFHSLLQSGLDDAQIPDAIRALEKGRVPKRREFHTTQAYFNALADILVAAAASGELSYYNTYAGLADTVMIQSAAELMPFREAAWYVEERDRILNKALPKVRFELALLFTDQRDFFGALLVFDALERGLQSYYLLRYIFMQMIRADRTSQARLQEALASAIVRIPRVTTGRRNDDLMLTDLTTLAKKVLDLTGPGAQGRANSVAT